MAGEKYIRRAGRRPGYRRRAAAVVEMAIVTPFLLALIFGIMEYGWVFMVQSSLTNSAREAARVGILPGSTDTDIRARFAEAISATGLDVSTYTLTITQPDPSTTPKTLKVQVAVPWSQVTLFGVLPKSMLSIVSGTHGTVRTNDMVASCTMLKEGSS